MRRASWTGSSPPSSCPALWAPAFADGAGGLIAFSTRIAKRFARPLDKGAETLVFLASASDAAEITGEYFQDCRRIAPSAAALDDVSAERMWLQSCKLAGFTAR